MTDTNGRFLAAAVIAFAAVNLSAQTQIDLRTQAKNASVSLLGDCQVIRTSASVLAVKAPCNVKTLGVVTSFSSGATITLTATTQTGMAQLGVDTTVNPPTLKLYVTGITTGNVTCSGMACVSVSGAAFGADDIQLAAIREVRKRKHRFALPYRELPDEDLAVSSFALKYTSDSKQ